jgi:hypothetical protein
MGEDADHEWDKQAHYLVANEADGSPSAYCME